MNLIKRTFEKKTYKKLIKTYKRSFLNQISKNQEINDVIIWD